MCETTGVQSDGSQTASSGAVIVNGDVNIKLKVSITLPDLLSPEHMMPSLDDFLASMAGDEGPTSISEAVHQAMDMAQSLGVPMRIIGGGPGVLEEVIAAIRARKGEGSEGPDLNALREQIKRQREEAGGCGCGGCGCGCGAGAKEPIVDDPGSEAVAPPSDAPEPPAQPGEVPGPQEPATPADQAGEE